MGAGSGGRSPSKRYDLRCMMDWVQLARGRVRTHRAGDAVPVGPRAWAVGPSHTAGCNTRSGWAVGRCCWCRCRARVPPGARSAVTRRDTHERAGSVGEGRSGGPFALRVCLSRAVVARDRRRQWCEAAAARQHAPCQTGAPRVAQQAHRLAAGANGQTGFAAHVARAASRRGKAAQAAAEPAEDRLVETHTAEEGTLLHSTGARETLQTSTPPGPPCTCVCTCACGAEGA